MTERDEYTPSGDQSREMYHWLRALGVGHPEARDRIESLIEAVRQEERERCAQIAESLDFGPAPLFSRAAAHRWGALQAAARIREQGKEQNR